MTQIVLKHPIFPGKLPLNERLSSAPRRPSVPRARVEQRSVFLNIPYDAKFRRLYLAYIVGLSELGLSAKATLGIPGGKARLDRIYDLIQTCRYSIHDLSRVELDRTVPRTPRFNMPFELGLAVAWSKSHPEAHTWFVCETRNRRAQKSLSDLNGTDLNIHNGTVIGVMRELRNAFVRARQERPSVPQMMSSYRVIRKLIPEILKRNGAKSEFEASVFDELCFIAVARVRQQRETRTS